MDTNLLFDAADRINSLPWPLNWIVWIIVVGGLSGWLGWKTIKFVHEGEVALVERRGAVRRDKAGEPLYKGKGLRFLNPLLDELIRVSILDRVFILDEIRIDHGPLLATDVKATLSFRVVNPYKTRYVTDNYDERVRGFCESDLRLAIYEVVKDGTISDADDSRIEGIFRTRIATDADYLGLELLSFRLSRVARNATVIQAAALALIGGSELARQILANPAG